MAREVTKDFCKFSIDCAVFLGAFSFHILQNIVQKIHFQYYTAADLVEKIVVPTERHLRSHGDKKKVVDVKVRYPGYVFCKIRLTEDVYEKLQELELTRSWMGTINRK